MSLNWKKFSEVWWWEKSREALFFFFVLVFYFYQWFCSVLERNDNDNGIGYELKTRVGTAGWREVLFLWKGGGVVFVFVIWVYLCLCLRSDL